MYKTHVYEYCFRNRLNAANNIKDTKYNILQSPTAAYDSAEPKYHIERHQTRSEQTR